MKIIVRIFKISVLFGIVINLVSLGITMYANKYAQKLTVIDESIRELAVNRLEIDSQIAIFRSSIFLTQDLKQKFVSQPEDVIYITPAYVKSEVYSYKP